MVIQIHQCCSGSAFQALPDLEALEDVEVAVVLVSQLLVAVQSQQGLSLLKFENYLSDIFSLKCSRWGSLGVS